MIDTHTLAAFKRLHDRIDRVAVRTEAMHALLCEVLETLQSLRTINLTFATQEWEVDTQEASEASTEYESEESSAVSVQTWP